MAVTTDVKAEYVKEIGIGIGLQALPPNFTKVDGNLNDGNWGTATYLAYKLTEDPADAITGVEVFAGYSPSFGIQTGFTKIDPQGPKQRHWTEFRVFGILEGKRKATCDWIGCCQWKQ